MNHCNECTRSQKEVFNYEGKHKCFGHKILTFNLLITIKNTSTVKDLNKSENIKGLL